MPLAPGARFGTHEIVARIGAGGMGEVWRARDTRLDREVALKVLPAATLTDETARARLLREARVASKLNHPHVCTIHEVGEAEGQAFIAMELVEGQSLATRLSGGALPLEQVLLYGQQVADALAHAHEKGVVHRDLKSANVVLTPEGRAKVLDFGLAKRLVGEDLSEATTASHDALTTPGTLAGTLAYMAPEQLRGQAADARSDIWALGVMLYEMATGRRPFQGPTGFALSLAILNEPPTALPPTTSGELRVVIERCLAKEPGQRYQHAGEVRASLETARSGGILPLPQPAKSAPSRRLWRPASAALLLLVAVLAAFDVGGLGLRLLRAAREIWGPGPPPGRPPVVAVLPLTNLTGQSEYDATAVGIAEVVVAGLSAIDGIQVLSRRATTGYRDRKDDLSKVARELDAVYLVDGVLQRSEEHLRVSFSLVRGPSSVVAWSGTFDGAFPQLFELQSRVAEGVAGALRVSISPPERARIQASPTASRLAWDEYTAALALLDRQDRPGNVAAAVSRLDAALGVDPRFARAHAAMARACQALYDETGEVSWADRARDSAQEALRLEPGDVEVRQALARILADRGRTTEAIDELKRALALKPGSDRTRRLLSEVLVDAGQPDAALDEARQAIALGPDNADNHMALGWVHFSVGRFRDAAAAYRRATELRPDSAWAYQMLGTSLHMAGDLGAAVAPYKEAIRLAPDARAWANLGAVYYTTGRLADAVRAYEEAARIEPGSGTIRRALGDARARSGAAPAAKADWTAALELSRVALRVNPRDERQLTNAAICLAKLGQKDAALSVAGEALATGKASAHAHYGAAVVHALAGDAPGALALLEKAFAVGASASQARDDDDFTTLRARPEFLKLLERAAAATKEVTRPS